MEMPAQATTQLGNAMMRMQALYFLLSPRHIRAIFWSYCQRRMGSALLVLPCTTLLTLLAVVLVVGWAAYGAEPTPASRPAKQQTTDDNLDWLLGHGQESDAPPPAQSLLGKSATGPSPFNNADDLGYRAGVITFSDGEKVHGKIATTLDKPIRLWDDQKQEYRDIPFKLIKSFQAKIIWEREEKEWHFRESGSDIKEYSGKTYPAREMQYIVTLINGQSVTGSVDAPLYLQMAKGDDKVLVMHKRDKGEIGTTLKELAYIKNVEFGEPSATTQP